FHIIRLFITTKSQRSLIREILQRERITYIVYYTHIHTYTIQSISSHNALEMSHEKLLSGDRKLFIWKICNEMDNNAMVNTSDGESRKVYFLQLVKRNKELSEIEKRYCRERCIYNFKLHNDD